MNEKAQAIAEFYLGDCACEEGVSCQSCRLARDIEEALKESDCNCKRCNGNGCPACDARKSGSKYNPEPY